MKTGDDQNFVKLCIWLLKDDYNIFKVLSGLKRTWTPGYTGKAGREAIWLWICYRQLWGKQIDYIYKIAQKKHPDLKDRRALTRVTVKESIEKYIEENKQVLEKA
jgi:hypothetical protein